MPAAQRSVGPEHLLAGVAAGLLASVIQVAIGKTEDLAFLPEWEDSNIAPRLVDRLARDLGEDLSPTAEWTLGTAFHLGYGAFWGASYAAARERTGVDPLVGGTALGALIWGITFPRWGGAVQTQTERPPEQRTWRMEVVLASVALGFGLSTSLLYERLRPADGPAAG